LRKFSVVSGCQWSVISLKKERHVGEHEVHVTNVVKQLLFWSDD